MAYTLTDRWKYYSEVGQDSRQSSVQTNATGTNYNNSTAFTYFPATPVANDYVHFAFVKRWWGLKLDIGTAFSATSVEFIWEYYTKVGGWSTLRVSNTNVFLSTGVQYVNFTPPADWGVEREKGFKIRCRIVSISGFATNATQQNTRVLFNLKAIVITGTESNTIGTTLLTANNAGTYTVLAATTSATGLIPIQASVYAIRDIAKVDCVLAGTSAGAGDTVDITGTDIDGNAIGETIDVSGGNATYISTLAYADVTQIDCNGFTDGTIAVNQKKQGIIEMCAPNTYVINCHIQIGDGSTTTAVTWNNYFITLMHGAFVYCLTSGTLTTGTIAGTGTAAETYTGGIALQEGSYDGQNLGIGSDWRGEAGTGVFNLGGSFWKFNKGAYSEPMFHTNNGTFNFLYSILSTTATGGREIYQNSTKYFKGTDNQLSIQFTGGSISSSGSVLHSLNAEIGNTGFEVANTPIRSGMSIWFYAGAGIGTYLNCDGVKTSSFGIGWGGAGTGVEKLRISSSLDVYLLDEAEQPISGASVKVVDGVGATVVNTTTDANGVITQQKLVAQSGAYTAGNPSITWTNKSSMTLTIKKVGYEKLAIPLELGGVTNSCEAQDLKLTLKRQNILIDQETT